MTEEEYVQQRVDHYAALFDLYLDTGRMPPPQAPDPLQEYIQEALSEPSNLLHCQHDPMWREVFRNAILDFATVMLRAFVPHIRFHWQERHMRAQLMLADTEGRQAQWNAIADAVSQTYTANEINMYGYQQQLTEADADQAEAICQAMCQQWEKASDNRLLREEEKLVAGHKQRFELTFREAGNADYKTLFDSKQTVYRYPPLIEIVEKIGRDRPKDKQEKDTTVTSYIPVLLSSSQPAAEVDSVTLGNTIPNVLPTEFVYLSDESTEDIFYHRFATRQLQLVASKPPTHSRKKTEQTKEQTPRLMKGPIIVSVDTSGSMMGKPMDIAKALLLQLLAIARRQHRPCYLITYAVHAQAIDIANPKAWRQVKKFLQEGFTGGTDGNEMLCEACSALQSKTYSMADVLIISDFEWSEPAASTKSKMEKEKLQGTKFYGLKINSHPRAREHKWLDQFWQVKL